VAVSGGLRFQQLTVAAVHVCGVTITGDAYCWGGGGNGRLGSGGTADSPVPVAVTGGLKFLAVAAGDAHTCGVTPLGAMYCWGRNNKGQLGIGNTTDSLTPALVIDPP
jgi:alpha-tubulin suppressor-like RCC1 family protein